MPENFTVAPSEQRLGRCGFTALVATLPIFVLAACGGGGGSTSSTSATTGGTTPTPTVQTNPDAPTLTAATPGFHSTKLNFTAPASTGSSAIVLYTATCNDGTR
ncbi:MAG: hypothetical protein RJB26_289, partial [Pseudomonadota bacterium]